MASTAMLASLPNDDSNRAPGFIACMTITSAIALVLVSLRVYVRVGIVRGFGADDCTILLAMICCILALCFDGLQVSQGFGKHVVHLTPQQQIDVRKWNFALEMPIIVGTALSKISISLLLLRLLGKSTRPMQKYILHGINFFVAAYSFIDIVNNAIACRPTAKLWDLERPGTCRPTDSVIAISYFQGACSAAVALTLSSLPIYFFSNLQMNPRTKVVVCLLMGLGVFDGVCSIVRCTLLPDYIKSLDFTYTAIPITIWGSLELNFAIMAACIPTLRPLFRFFDGNKAGTDSSPSSRGTLLRFFASSKTGTSHPSSRGFVKQSDDAQSRAFGSDRDVGAEAQYGLTSFEISQSDGRSERSTHLLQDPATIRKTTEVDVVAQMPR